MMKRRARRRPTQSPAAPHDPPANPGRAMVLVDGSGIRKKIRKDYDKALRDLADSRRQLDQFHQTDAPQFTRWLNTHFGALLTELRELSHKIVADEELVFQVESEVLFGGGSHVRAYKRVIEARENPRPQPPPPIDDGEPGSEREPAGARPEPEDFDDPLAALFNEFFGGSEPDEDPPGKQGPWRGLFNAPAAPPADSARLKNLYRTLVRRLHPDTQPEMTSQKLEWWHQAQAAYEAGDVEQLEVILTLCEIGDSGTTSHTSASLLQRITAQLKSSLREIKRQLAGRRRDPAWGFSRRVDHEVMVLQMRRTLTRDLEEMQERWRPIRELIAGWKAAAERLKPPRRRKSAAQTQNPEFLF